MNAVLHDHAASHAAFSRDRKIALVIAGHPLIDIRGPAWAEFLYRDPVMRGDMPWASCQLP
jgi:hypothetical protein